MFTTPQELDQYIRLTLKQWNISDVSFSFKKMERSLGYFWAEKNEIVFSFKALKNFVLFREVLLHELAHKLDFKERGTFKKENGKNDLHGKNWKKYCQQLKIPARRFIPA